jgi:hypothetical protein
VLDARWCFRASVLPCFRASVLPCFRASTASARRACAQQMTLRRHCARACWRRGQHLNRRPLSYGRPVAPVLGTRGLPAWRGSGNGVRSGCRAPGQEGEYERGQQRGTESLILQRSVTRMLMCWRRSGRRRGAEHAQRTLSLPYARSARWPWRPAHLHVHGRLPGT